MKVRAKIENLSLEEIYKDYCTIKAMDEKYYYGGTEKIKNASDALMNILKNEILRRKLKELDTDRNVNTIREALDQINKDTQQNPLGQLPNLSTTKDFVDEFQNYTTSFSCGGCEADNVHYDVQG